MTKKHIGYPRGAWVEWRLPPDERYYRFVDSISIEVEKKESDNHSYVVRVGDRVPLKRELFNPVEKNSIQIRTSFMGREIIGHTPQWISEKLAPQMDKGTIFVGWIKSGNMENRTLQIDIYERLKIPYNGMLHLVWKDGGFGGTSASVEISMRDRKMVYNSFNIPMLSTKPERSIPITFSPDQWKTFVHPAMTACNFMAWADNNRYYNPHIFDGEQWSMKILQSGLLRRKEKIIRDIFGSNDYPEEWETFRYFIAACLELYGPQDRKTHYPLRNSIDGEIAFLGEWYGLQQIKIAEMLGVSVKEVSEWEKGSSKPDGLTLMKLYELVDAAMQELKMKEPTYET